MKRKGDGEKRAMGWPAFHGAYWVMSLWSMTYHRSVTCALRRTPGHFALPCRFRKSRISPGVPGPDWRGGGGRGPKGCHALRTRMSCLTVSLEASKRDPPPHA